MRAAPPVQALSGGIGARQALQRLLQALSAASLAHWAGRWRFGPGPQVALGAAACAALAAWVASLAARPVAHWLVWDGANWTVEVPGSSRVTGQVCVMLDLGDWVLLRFAANMRGKAGAVQRIWLPMSRGEAGAAWHGLRTALHSPAASARADPGALRGAGRDA
jgi:hypothetical protein